MNRLRGPANHLEVSELALRQLQMALKAPLALASSCSALFASHKLPPTPAGTSRLIRQRPSPDRDGLSGGASDFI